MTSGSAVPPDGPAWPAGQPASAGSPARDHADPETAGPSRQRTAEYGGPEGAEPAARLSRERAYRTEDDGGNDDEYEPL